MLDNVCIYSFFIHPVTYLFGVGLGGTLQQDLGCSVPPILKQTNKRKSNQPANKQNKQTNSLDMYCFMIKDIIDYIQRSALGRHVWTRHQ